MSKPRIQWDVLFVYLLVLCISAAWAVLLFSLASCSKELSNEGGTLPQRFPACVYLKVLKVPTDFNGHYAYNADLYYQDDTTREIQQGNIQPRDTARALSLDHSVICNYRIEFNKDSATYFKFTDSIPPAPPVKCMYFKLIRTGSPCIYSADLYELTDTVTGAKRYGTRDTDSTYWKGLNRQTVCNYFIENKTSTILPR